MPKARKNKYPPATPKEHEGQQIRIRHTVKPKNYGQELYLESLREVPLTICGGPAGSGKTYIATAIALEKLLSREIDKIVITRPVVEAGENLGFLPGTLEEKLDPYLLPLMDAIEDHIGPMATKRLMESGKIEIAPLAFMRGRTFNNCLPGDHLVLLSSGQWVRMDELLDKFNNGHALSVKSVNIHTMEVEDKNVEFAFKQPNQYRKLVRVTLENGQIILATPDHKLFTQRGYVPVNNLTIEDKLVGVDNDFFITQISTSKIELIDDESDVYDITVEDNHNFFTNGGVLSSNCFVILDEAQNTTVEQMRMFVTRMGYDSVFSVNGDTTQSDLKRPHRYEGDKWENGLDFIIRKLVGRDANINYIEFSNKDVVRSEMVKKILTFLDSPEPKPEYYER